MYYSQNTINQFSQKKKKIIWFRKCRCQHENDTNYGDGFIRQNYESLFLGGGGECDNNADAVIKFMHFANLLFPDW